MSSRILILEDDPLIALDLCALVEECGHEVLRVCGSVAEAESVPHPDVDFAFLDIDVADGKSFPFARRLRARRIPFVFVSAARAADLPPELRGIPFIPKPYAACSVRSALPA